MRFFLLAPLFFFTACVGGSLGNSSEFEEYPLRSASESEAGRLKHCLRSAFRLQQAKKAKTGEYFRKASEFPLDSECDGFMLHQKKTPQGFELMAQFHENEFTVRWTINEKGVIEEHMEEEMAEDFGF
jgi:hypothetical protein